MMKSGSFVQIRAVVLGVGERADGVPEDTAGVPLIMWVKGHLEGDSEIGQAVRVRTVSGRLADGILEVVEPVIDLDYGGFVPEILEIGARVREALYG
jgi:hypothetical protein